MELERKIPSACPRRTHALFRLAAGGGAWRLTGHSACRSLVPPPCGIRRGGHGAVQAQVSSPVPAAFPRRPREPGRAHPAVRRPPQVPSVRAGVRGPALPPEPGRPRAGRARPRHDRPGARGLRRRRLLRGLCRYEGLADGVRGALCGEARPVCRVFTMVEGSRKAGVRRIQN